MGIKFEEEVLALWLLNTLPESWEMFRVTLANVAPKGGVKVEYVKGLKNVKIKSSYYFNLSIRFLPPHVCWGSHHYSLLFLCFALESKEKGPSQYL